MNKLEKLGLCFWVLGVAALIEFGSDWVGWAMRAVGFIAFVYGSDIVAAFSTDKEPTR